MRGREGGAAREQTKQLYITRRDPTLSKEHTSTSLTFTPQLKHMKPKRDLGQNFLIDKEVAKRLVDIANVTNKDVVLEIGAGKGFLSEEIAKRAGELIAIEIDESLIPKLKENLFAFKNIKIITGDALMLLNHDEGAQKDNSERSRGSHALLGMTSQIEKLYLTYQTNKIVSSIPYQITSPLLHRLVNYKDQLEVISLLIQKEVAKRITAKAPKSNYLAAFLQTFFEIKITDLVDKYSFNPVPKVDSAVIKITPLKECLVENKEVQKYSKFLHHAFKNQRKMLNKRFKSRDLEALEIDPKRRAETLTINEWVKLFNETTNGVKDI